MNPAAVKIRWQSSTTKNPPHFPCCFLSKLVVSSKALQIHTPLPSVLNDPVSFHYFWIYSTRLVYFFQKIMLSFYNVKSAIKAPALTSRTRSARCNNISMKAAFKLWAVFPLDASSLKEEKITTLQINIDDSIQKSQCDSSFLWATDSINSLACLRSFQFPLSLDCQHFKYSWGGVAPAHNFWPSD